MELSITFTEFALLCWAVIATAAALKYKEEARHTKIVLNAFIHDEDARAQILAAKARFDKFMKGLDHEH
jgi:hypothetical protein